MLKFFPSFVILFLHVDNFERFVHFIHIVFISMWIRFIFSYQMTEIYLFEVLSTSYGQLISLYPRSSLSTSLYTGSGSYSHT